MRQVRDAPAARSRLFVVVATEGMGKGREEGKAAGSPSFHSQVMGAVGRFIHPMAFFQEFEEFLDRNSRVRRPSQSEDLP